MNWQELSTVSHPQTAMAVLDVLNQGNVEEARRGLEELIEALSRADRRAVRAQLTRAMVHVIKWKSQPERRSPSWSASIEDAREEIRDYQEDNPSITDEEIRAIWDKCFKAALRRATAEMQQPAQVRSLSWEDVFEAEYRV